jgi:chorismate mutase
MTKKSDYQEKIELFRSEIDLIDTKIINLIHQRLDLVKNIGALKKEYNTPIIDIDREFALKKLHNKIAQKKDIMFSLLYRRQYLISLIE